MATQDLTNFVFDYETMSVWPADDPLLGYPNPGSNSGSNPGYPNPGFPNPGFAEINDITVERKMELKKLAHRDSTPDDVLNDILDQPLVTTGIILTFESV